MSVSIFFVVVLVFSVFGNVFGRDVKVSDSSVFLGIIESSQDGIVTQFSIFEYATLPVDWNPEKYRGELTSKVGYLNLSGDLIGIYQNDSDDQKLIFKSWKEEVFGDLYQEIEVRSPSKDVYLKFEINPEVYMYVFVPFEEAYTSNLDLLSIYSTDYVGENQLYPVGLSTYGGNLSQYLDWQVWYTSETPKDVFTTTAYISEWWIETPSAGETVTITARAKDRGGWVQSSRTIGIIENDFEFSFSLPENVLVGETLEIVPVTDKLCNLPLSYVVVVYNNLTGESHKYRQNIFWIFEPGRYQVSVDATCVSYVKSGMTATMTTNYAVNVVVNERSERIYLPNLSK